MVILYKIGSKTAIELTKVKLAKEEHEDPQISKLDELESLINGNRHHIQIRKELKN